MNGIPLQDLNGKTIWVVGGAGYLGGALITLLSELRARVLCIDVDDRAEKFMRSNELQSNIIPLTFDINDTARVPEFTKELVSQFGCPDGLVNLAFGSTSEKLEDLTDSDFDRINHTGLTATFIMAREVGFHMLKRKSGSIVLFSSMYGMVSPNEEVYQHPMTKNPIEYGVSKAGIIQMTKYLAVHWAKSGVRVNCVSPGPFPNPNVQKDFPDFMSRLAEKSPMGRIGKASEIAGPVVFLLSDLASYITGHNVVVDGGWTVW